MRRLALFVVFLAIALLLTIGITELTQLSLFFSAVIAIFCCVLLYLMLDLRPERPANEATLIRLAKGTWSRRSD